MRLSRMEVLAAIAAFAFATAAAVSGYVMRSEAVRMVQPAPDVVPPLSEAELRRIGIEMLKQAYRDKAEQEQHLTDWQGMSGGATPGSTVVKTVPIQRPITWPLDDGR